MPRKGKRGRKHAGAPDWSRDDLRTLIDAPKDAHGGIATWSPSFLPNGELFFAELSFHAVCGGQGLLVRAKWKGDDDQQVLLQVPHASWNIVRLCVSRVHSAEPHWHFYEHVPGGFDEQEDAPDAPRGAGAMDELLAFFIKEQGVVNLTVERKLFP